MLRNFLPERSFQCSEAIPGDIIVTIRDNQNPSEELPLCMRRRELLMASAVGATAATLAPGVTMAATDDGVGTYPRLSVIKLGDLVEGEPVAFNYPLEEQPNMIVKLGSPAQGGIGPDEDIVAFSILCTHMGGSLRGKYDHVFKSMGPCPFHFSTFDLTKSGAIVHASATQHLPQVRLEVDGDDVIAVGMNGLVYGYRDNLKDGTPVVMKG